MITVTVQHDDPRTVRQMLAQLLGTTADVATHFSVAGLLDQQAIRDHITSTPNTGTISPATPIAATGPAYAPTDVEDDEAGAPVSTASADSSGMPWDERIHSAARSTNADGTWRKRKGIDKTIIPGIEAELRSKVNAAGMGDALKAEGLPAPATPSPLPPPMPIAAPLPVPAAAAPITPPPPPMPTPVTTPAPMPEPIAQPAPVPTPTPTPAPAEPAAVPSDFHGFMQHLSTKMTTPGSGVTPDYLTTLAQRIGTGYQVPFHAVTDLQESPQYIPYAVQLMQHDGTW